MTRISLILVLAATLALGACGTERQNPLRGALGNALKQLTNRQPKQVLTTADIRARLTPELRAQIGRPVLIVELPKLKVAAGVIEVAQNGGHVTWFAEDGVGLSTRSGLLTSTRGLGFDLMSADVAGPLSVITGRGTGQALRVHRYLDGEDQEYAIRFTCTYVRRQTLVSESCDAEGKQHQGLVIQNRYWLTKAGKIWRSEQWAGARNGYMLIEVPK